MPCLLCGRHNEKTAKKHICAACIRTLTKSRQADINETYKKAVESERWPLAWGLVSFASRDVRKAHPIPRRILTRVSQ